MVAADVYLARLKEQFPNSRRLPSSFLAWSEQASKGRGTLTVDQLARAQESATAYDQADRSLLG